MMFLESLRRRIDNEKGAELVEWAIWIGAIAVVAAAVWTGLGPAISGKVSSVISSITGHP